MSRQSWKLKLAGYMVVGLMIVSSENCVWAEITPDRSLGKHNSVVRSPDNNRRQEQIEGGLRRRANLLHSFEEFTVKEGKTVYFDSPDGVENIFSRVTGGNESEILGTLGVKGTANLFLINPNGIIFGRNARLDLRGSFVATTADSIHFDHGEQFSAADTQTLPLLRITAPIGLGFGQTPGKIVNRSVANTVDAEQTLALVGGNVLLEGGRLTAEGGRIEVGSVGENSLVGLSVVKKSWNLNYREVENFGDIQLSRSSVINVSGQSSGDVQIQGRQVRFTGGSIIQAVNEGLGSAGNVVVTASELVEISGFSGLLSPSQDVGDSSNVMINTSKLLFDQGFIFTNSLGEGRSGNLTINASESVEIRGDFSVLSTIVQGGNRNAGNLIINTERLIVQNGAEILTETQSNGRAGNLSINTGQLIVENQAQVSVSATQSGSAGNLAVDADSIIVNNGTIKANTNLGSGGNLLLNADNILLRDRSLITTNAENSDGGNIEIGTDTLIALNNSDITANAGQGQGGRIIINAQGIFGIEARSELTAKSDLTATSQLGVDFNGEVILNNPDLDPARGIAELPSTTIDVENLIAQNLCALEDGKIAGGSSLTITGRGGLPPSAEDSLINTTRIVDWATLSSRSEQARPNSPVVLSDRSVTNNHSTIRQAQGLVKAADGTIILTAYAPEAIAQKNSITHPQCQGARVNEHR